MDNQAGSFVLEWLAGFCDADGSINIRRTNVRRRKTVDYTPEVSFFNSNSLINEKVIEILDSLDINKYVWTNSKGVTSITVKRFTKILSLVELLFPYLVVKKPASYIVSEYCKSRLSDFSNKTYSNLELSLFKTMKKFLMEINSKTSLCKDLDNVKFFRIPKLSFNITPAWLAGFIDGDGCITIIKQTRNNGNVNYYPRVNITSCSNKAITLISEMFNKEQISHSTSWRSSKHSLDWCEINVQSIQSVKRVLHIVRPYLVGKSEQALLVSKACDIKTRKNCEHLIKDIRDKVTKLNTRSLRDLV